MRFYLILMLFPIFVFAQDFQENQFKIILNKCEKSTLLTKNGSKIETEKDILKKYSCSQFNNIVICSKIENGVFENKSYFLEKSEENQMKFSNSSGSESFLVKNRRVYYSEKKTEPNFVSEVCKGVFINYFSVEYQKILNLDDGLKNIIEKLNGVIYESK